MSEPAHEPWEEPATEAPRRRGGRRDGEGTAGGGRRWRRGAAALLLVLLASAPWWGPRLLAQLAFFRVRRVELVGARYIAPRDILRRLAVDTLASVWDPTGPLQARVAAHPSVKAARVRRKLPGTLVVEVTEWTPVALVPTRDGLRPFDERGVALPTDPAWTPVDVPVLLQRDTTVLRLLGAVQREAPSLFARVSEVRRTGAEELLLRLDTVPVRARTDVTPQRLWEIQPVERDLARRQRRVVELDLRYRDQVIARVQ